MYQIEKNIPFSTGRHRFPFREMEVGDSFQINPNDRRRVASAASYYGKRNKKKFSIRMSPESTRVWRVL